MNLGLCICCGQSGHLARACPHQYPRPPGSLEGRATHFGPISDEPEPPKKNSAVYSHPGKPTV